MGRLPQAGPRHGPGPGALDQEEEGHLNKFHVGMDDRIRTLANEDFSHSLQARYTDEVYNNQFRGYVAPRNDPTTCILATSFIGQD